MSETLEHIETAIDEVTRAREAVQRSKTPQVRAADERDRLKAVAFAWFKTHRVHLGDTDVGDVDAAYQTVLDATARLAARSTYANALKDAKAALIAVRRTQTAAPTRPASAGASKPEPAPAFSSLTSDVAMQSILSRRWDEVQACIGVGANLAATVMMGGLLETLLLARINVVGNKAPLFTAKHAPKDKTGKTLALADWKLLAMVEVAHEVGWITKSTKDVGNVLRDFRNYIHPHKEHTDGVRIDADDVRMFWEVCKTISRQILSSVAKSP
jgi:hypothetical protein